MNNFYLEIQDHGLDDQKRINPSLIKLSKASLKAKSIRQSPCRWHLFEIVQKIRILKMVIFKERKRKQLITQKQHHPILIYND